MKKIKLHYQILISMILAIIVSFLFTGSTIFIPLGDLFIRLLKMIIVPLIFSSIVVGIGSINKSVNMKSISIKTVLYYLSTSLIAITIGLALTNAIKPGQYFSINESNQYSFCERKAYNSIEECSKECNVDCTDKPLLSKATSFGDMLYRIIPENPVKSFVDGDMLSIIFFSILLGFAITRLKENHRNSINSFFISLHEAIMYITNLIITLAPIGVFGLIIKAFHHSGTNLIPSIGMYMLTILIGLSIHILVILPLIFKFFTKISPFTHYKAMSKAMLTAFSTSSSSATLPVTMNCVQEKVGVSKTTSSFVLPLGSTINMDGTALYECAGVLFISQVLQIDLTILQQFTIVLTALLASIGAAGIPSAGLVMIFIVLKSVGLDTHPEVGIIVGTMLAVDRPLDMLRTMTNVTSDSIGAAIIGKSEGDKLYSKD
tara:strand:+ start:434 stop:1729 length:1296 start_codon:yes stop_codon:yes gene_type:complete